MKLLSSKEINKRKNAELDELDRKKRRITSYINTELKKINEVNVNLDPEKKKKRKEFEDFCRGIQFKKANLLEQLAELETRKEISQRSLDNVRDEIYFKHQENKSLKFKLEQKEKELETDRKLISEQLRYVNKKIESIARQEKELIDNKKIIKNSLEFVKGERKKLIGERKEFEKTVSVKKEEIAEEKKKIEEVKKSNQIIKEALIEQQSQIEKEWIRIRDERQMLERAKAEIYGRSKKR
ncbi:MAG: hypothetical protein WCW77_00510 [Patescibacteria group bacterium]|jgi:hypothetical protein